MPNIGALWAEMRGVGGWGGGWSSGFCGKNHKVPGYFLQVGGWVGACSETSLFSESTL